MKSSNSFVSRQRAKGRRRRRRTGREGAELEEEEEEEAREAVGLVVKTVRGWRSEGGGRESVRSDQREFGIFESEKEKDGGGGGEGRGIGA